MKRKNKVQEAKNTASRVFLMIIAIPFLWLAVGSMAWQEDKYLTEAEMEAIVKEKIKETEPVKSQYTPRVKKLSVFLQNNQMDYLYAGGAGIKQSAKARQLLANK